MAAPRNSLTLTLLANQMAPGLRRGLYYSVKEQRGKPDKVALVALRRKLLLQLQAVARRGIKMELARPHMSVKTDYFRLFP